VRLKQKTHIYLLLVLILALFTSNGNSQSWGEFKDDIIYSWDTSINFGKAILQPDQSDLRALAVSSFFVVASSALDRTGRDFSQNNHNAFLDSFFKIDHYYGDRKIMMFGPVALYAAGFLSGYRDLKDTGLQTLQAVLYTGLITSAMKDAIGRSRPYRNKGPYDFEPFAIREENRSFWSGHSSVTFAASTVLANRIDNVYWKIFWYGASTCVAGARMYHDKHWLSDVVAGALVGYAVGSFVSHQGEKRYKDNKEIRESAGLTRDGFYINFYIPLNK
jgi:membrane-associated phospholipid phosphatase